jgi:hypothetical protein
MKDFAYPNRFVELIKGMMMNKRQALIDLLLSTTEAIKFSISQIPDNRFTAAPPHPSHPNSDKGFKTYFGEWSASRLLFHLVFYEEKYAIPTLRHWLGDPHPKLDLIFPDPTLEQSEWDRMDDGDLQSGTLLERLRDARTEQIEVLKAIPKDVLETELISTGLGAVSAIFVTTKTIQHTLEHGNDLYKNALYWERALDWLDT